MTRTEFIEKAALKCGVEAPFANLGFFQIGDHYRIVMPCACGDEICEGWAMVGPDSVDSHLMLQAPEPLRKAYCDAVILNKR